MKRKLFTIIFISLASLFGFAKNQKVGDDLQGPFFISDESPIQVIRILEELTGQTSLQAHDLPNVKINFQTNGKLTRDEAIISIKSLLSVNGIAITPLNDKFFRVAPAKGVNTQAPTFIVGKAADIKDNQFFYTKLYELKYIETSVLQDVLKSFITPNDIAAVVFFPRSNAFLLTDTLSNQKRVEMLVEKLDVPASVTEEIGFFQLKYTTAEDMKSRLSALSGELLKKYFDKTAIEADSRTNQIIVITQHGNLNRIKELIEKIDIDSDPITSSKVFYIKHGEAKDVASVLNEIIRGQQNATKINQSSQNLRARRATTTQANNNVQARGASQPRNNRFFPGMNFSQTGASLQFSNYVTIVPDERSNSIVAYGTQNDLKQAADIISQVDVVLAQVKIDVIITEVSLIDNQVSGLSTFGISYTENPAEGGVRGWSADTKTLALSNSDSTSAFSLGISEKGFNAIFNIAEQNSRVKILSSPSITTTHNQRAIVNVSTRRPLIKGTTSYDGTSYPTTKSEIEWRDIGILLEVTPRIGDNGIVQMQIKQTIESVTGEVEIDAVKQPLIGKREAESYVSAMTNEIIVLGGLQQQTTNTSDGKVWLLSDIPLIGNWFKPERDQNERTELIIFIRPTVVKSKSLASFSENNEITADDVKEDVNRMLNTGAFHDKKNDKLKPDSHKQSSFFKTIYPLKDDDKSSLKNDNLKSTQNGDLKQPKRPLRIKH